MAGARRLLVVLFGVGALLGSATCSSPSRPSVSVGAAAPVSPANGAQVSFYDQPVTLIATNGVVTSGAAVTDTFEVATSADFAKVVASKDVPQAGGGRTAATFDALSAGTDYYWRVKTNSADASAVSAVSKFTVGLKRAIQPPVSVQPAPNSLQHRRPTFTISNSDRSGPITSILYHFDVATDAGFTAIAASGAVPEGTGQTSFTPTADLASGVTYYWRVQAADTGSDTTSGYSTSQSFTTVKPDSGTYSYSLALHLVSASGCSSDGTPIDKPAPFVDVTFAGTLTVIGDQLTFVFTDHPSDLYQLTLTAVRGGPQLSGTLNGNVHPWPDQLKFAPLFVAFKNMTITSGTGDNATGRLSGNVTGYYGDEGFPYYYGCTNGQLSFTLAPR